MMTKGRAAFAGVAAAAVALGVGELVAVVTGPRSGPLIAVGGWIVDHVPEAGKEFAIFLFGTNDKVALLIGTVVVLAGIAAVIGVLARIRPLAGTLGIGLFGVLGAAAALAGPDAVVTATLPSLLGAGAGMLTLRLLLRRAQIPASNSARETRRSGDPLTSQRRRFLATAGLTVVGAGAVGALGRSLQLRTDVSQARAEVTLPTPVSPAPPLPANVAPGLVTPSKDFYRIDTALITPRVDPATWTLRVHGKVDRELTITYAELMAMPMVERYITLACVSNGVGGDLIGNARWLGVPVKELLERAGPQAGADQVVSRSADGWTCGTPTAALLDGRDALLAVGMNGEPLPIEHGFPVRMVVPGLYGYVSACKWISEWEVTTFAAFDAYWVPRGWAAQATIKTQSRIDTPRGNVTRSAGDIVISGVAWAQHRGLDRVEVRIDDGPWQVAELLDTVSIDTWRQWRLSWAATPGQHTIAVRATDAQGVTQTGDLQDPVPDGATGWHTVRIQVK
jgi:DMSO/TMAO reductase YedYZ molybdopterin-dependent catalytic subunit